MMSIFSPFDAFCAESNGKKLFNFSHRPSSSSSSSSDSATQSDRKSSATSSSLSATVDRDHHDTCLKRENAIPVIKKETENSNKIDDRSGRRPSTKKRNARFAVEFDGLHCFETIIPY